jgi:hypothetical protein
MSNLAGLSIDELPALSLELMLEVIRRLRIGEAQRAD